jgi:hypothetical protein
LGHLLVDSLSLLLVTCFAINIFVTFTVGFFQLTHTAIEVIIGDDNRDIIWLKVGNCQSLPMFSLSTLLDNNTTISVLSPEDM